MTDWQAALRQAVQDRWENGQNVFYVAQVRPFLTRLGVDVGGLLEGRQVRYFIEAELPDLKQIQHDREPTVWGLVPAEAPIDASTDRYFEKVRKDRPSQTTFPFQNALRVAFTRSLEAGKARWLILSPVRFVDLPTGEVEPSAFEVPRDQIEPGASGERLGQRVEAFIRACGLDPDLFRIGQVRPIQTIKGRTALHQFLNLIPASDLSRVSMPLDIVRRLLDHSDEAHR